MAREKYRFNTETLSYDRIDRSFKRKLLGFLPHFLASVVGAIILYTCFQLFFDSPKERHLRRENKQLLVQYEIMNKKLESIDKVSADLQYTDDKIYRVIFEMDPIPKSIREAGIGGVNRYEDLEGYNYSDIVIETARKLDKISKKLYVQSKSYDKIKEYVTNKEKMLASRPAIQPILNKDLTRVASFFGIRIDPVYGYPKMHEGMDFTAPVGTKIFATGDGKVIEAKRSRRGYGNLIIIDHGFSYTTRYAHLSKIFVKPGQKVKRGDVIGLVGNTGKSVGPHLHYEVRKNNKPVNPINYYFLDITPAEYDKMIEMSFKSGQSLD